MADWDNDIDSTSYLHGSHIGSSTSNDTGQSVDTAVDETTAVSQGLGGDDASTGGTETSQAAFGGEVQDGMTAEGEEDALADGEEALSEEDEELLGGEEEEEFTEEEDGEEFAGEEDDELAEEEDAEAFGGEEAEETTDDLESSLATTGSETVENDDEAAGIDFTESGLAATNEAMAAEGVVVGDFIEDELAETGGEGSAKEETDDSALATEAEEDESWAEESDDEALADDSDISSQAGGYVEGGDEYDSLPDVPVDAPSFTDDVR